MPGRRTCAAPSPAAGGGGRRNVRRQPALPFDRKLILHQVVVNWYPKIQAMKSAGVAGGDDDVQRPWHG